MKKLLGVLFTFLVAGTPAQATLLDRGSGMVYDTDLKITWLQNWNLAKTAGYDADGLMNWYQAKTWADSLIYAGYDDWRLPRTVQPDTTCSNTSYWYSTPQYLGLHCLASDFGHVWYSELGNSGTLTNTGVFSDVQTELGYWSDTQFGAYCGPEVCAWAFQVADGRQTAVVSSGQRYAVAVRDGDVFHIPEPGTALLILAAGLGIIGSRHSYKNRKFRPL